MNAIAPSAALRCLADPEFLSSLSENARAILKYIPEFWLRESQIIPNTNWSTFGYIGGRGCGKSYANACWINQQAAREKILIALVAQTEPDAQRIQVQPLIETAPPWNRAEEYDGGVRWANGSRAHVYSAEVADAGRGPTFNIAWCSELVAWPKNTRKEVWSNIATATRGANARILFDTTSKGKNDLILARLADHAANPNAYPIVRETMFDNEWLTRRYLRDQLRQYPRGRKRDEEVFGKVFQESAGALWEQDWIDRNRRTTSGKRRLRLVVLDPALTVGPEADETGFIVGELCDDDDIYVIEDHSAKLLPREIADRAIDCCEKGAAGIVTEHNRGGLWIDTVLRERAEARKFVVRDFPPSNGKPFPEHTPGVIYLRVHKTPDGKDSRAYAPAARYERNRVHHVGHFDELETEMTTWTPDDSRSPNRLDAAVYLVLELSGLMRDKPTIEPRRQVKEAVAAGVELQRRLETFHRSRTIGFL